MSDQENVYLDTSFIIAVLENQKGRQAEALRILGYEKRIGAVVHTSALTINEFLSRYYDRFRGSDDCEEQVDRALENVRGIARIQAMSTDVLRRAAHLMSCWRAQHGKLDPDHPCRKKLRWDSIHLATAEKIKAARAYAWDDHWNTCPASEMRHPVRIISPAKCLQANLTDAP